MKWPSDGGMSAQGSAKQRCLAGGSAKGNVCLVGCLSGGDVHLPPWTEFLTHACENITFPQLRLQMVKIRFSLDVTS